MASIAPQDRAKIVSVISAAIRQDGQVRLNQLARVFGENGLDRNIYQTTGPKRWLQDNFSKEFFVAGNNGLERVLFANDPIGKTWNVLNDAVERDGRVLLAVVPELLENHGILYKQYARPGQKLGEWLRATFPDFTISEDGNSLLSRLAGSAPKPTLSENAKAEITQMHTVAFMNAWSGNLRQLRAYNSAYTSEDSVRPVIAHQLAMALMGVSGIAIDARTEAEPRVAFDTGLVTAAGHSIYCFLIPSSTVPESRRQSWVMEAFATTDDKTPLGAWLKNHGVFSSDMTAGLSSLESQLEDVGSKQESLLPLLEAYCEQLRKGKLPAAAVAKAAADYENAANALKQQYKEVWGEAYPGDASVQMIAEQLKGKNALTRQIKSYVETFDLIADHAHDLFVRSKLPEAEQSTPRKDKEIIHQNYDAPAGNVDFDLFEKTLQPYLALFEVMNAPTVTEQVETLIETVLCPHFSEISFRFAVRFLVNYGQSEEDRAELEDFRPVVRLAEALDELEQYALSPSRNADKPSQPAKKIAADELLSGCLRVLGDGMSAMGYARSVLPADEPGRILVLGQIKRLKQYLNSHRDTLDFAEAGLTAIAQGELPEGMTYFAAASRLYRIIQNRDQLAEKYFILGITAGDSRCATALLDLYRDTGNADAFCSIVETFSLDKALSFEDQVFYLSTLCKRSAEDALAYARRNCPLLYQKPCLELLLSLPAGSLPPDTVQTLQRRMETLYSYTHVNPLEQAVIDGDRAAIRRLAADPQELQAMGYTPEETDRIVRTAGEGQWEDFNSLDAYDIGCRLYSFQKNAHCLAERYMWEGIAQNRNTVGMHLMLILVAERRWDECCALYERFEDLYAGNINCRQYYLLALLQQDGANTLDHIRGDLQNCLLIVNTSPAVRLTLQNLSAPGASPNAAFYGDLLKLNELLDEPLIRSVVAMDRLLREYAASETAGSPDLPADVAAGIGVLYKSDSYPHGADAVSVSGRCFRFFGTYKGAAEAFARFALPDPKAADLLWEIYTALDDEPELLGLLQDYPDMQTAHKDQYLTFLFQRESYDAFIAAVEGEDDGESASDGLALQLFIAKLKLDPASDIPLPDTPNIEDSAEMSDWFLSWGGQLIATLLECGRIQDAERVLFDNFSLWLDKYPPDALRQITAGLNATQSKSLSTIQQDAVSAGKTDLALYLFKTLHVGRLEELADQYLGQTLSEIDLLDNDAKLKRLTRLQTLYGGSLGEVDAQISLLKIRSILNDPALDQDQTADLIGQIIESYPDDESSAEQLMALLDGSPVCYSYRVHSGLNARFAKPGGQNSALLFLHRQALLPEAAKNDEYLSFVCQLYIRAFSNDSFPDSILSEAMELCSQYVDRSRSAEGIMCLYYGQRRLGREEYACFLLRTLADQSAEMLGDELSKLVSSEVQKTWASDIPGYFDLFRDALNNLSIADIREYIDFAHTTVSYDAEAETKLRSSLSSREADGRVLSENESNSLVQMLFTNPTDANIWRQCIKLSLQDHPVAYAKLLHLASLHVTTLWPKCADYCEKYEQSDLLLDTLLSWAARDADSCRKFLDEHLAAQPDYLEKWADKPEMPELADTLCNGIPRRKNDFRSVLRSLSLIAVKSGSPEALAHLLKKFASDLLGVYCDLGVVTAVRLLLDSRFQEAGQLLGRLNASHAPMNYRGMVETLSAMDEASLSDWAGRPENQTLLRLVLPDGSAPTAEQINAITCDGIRNGQTRETAGVLRHVLRQFPDEYAAYNALFLLCGSKFDGYIPVLHEALRGLVRLLPNAADKPLYPRSIKHYARLLAVLDALVISNGMIDQIQDYDWQNENYDTRVSAADLSIPELNEISKLRAKTIEGLNNRSRDEVRRRTQAYLSCITCNWKDLLAAAWEKKANIRQELKIQINDDDGADAGFIRSVLLIIAEMDSKQQRHEFLTWLTSMLESGGGKPASPRLKHKDFIVSFVNTGAYAALEAAPAVLKDMLLLPVEEPCVSRSVKKTYIDPAVAVSAPYLFPLTWLAGTLIDDEEFQNSIKIVAGSMFDQSRDAAAYALYRALDCLAGSRTGKAGSSSHAAFIEKETYATKCRLSGLFSGEKAVVKQVASPAYSVVSCINMVMTLLYSISRGNDVMRLMPYLGEDNLRVAQLLVTAFDGRVDDQVKLAQLSLIPDMRARAYCCYVLRYPYLPDNDRSSYALASDEAAETANSMYLDLVKSLGPTFGKTTPFNKLLLGNWAVSTSGLSKTPMQWSAGSAENDPANIQIPAFAQGLAPLDGKADVRRLISKRQQIQDLDENAQQEKLRLSQQIYQLRLAANDFTAPFWDALLLYGSDCYQAALDRNDMQTANSIIYELTDLLRQGLSFDYGYQQAEKTIQETALVQCLMSFQSLSDMLKDYGTYNSAFHYMRTTLKEPGLADCVSQIYDVLDSLRSSLSSSISQEAQRERLSASYRKLEDISKNDWMYLKNHLQALINNKIYELDRRPVLQVEVLNTGKQSYAGCLFGQVSNIGQVQAENVILQANYDNNQHSDQYVLSRLPAGDKAVFEVDYSAAESVQSLGYYLNISFSYSGKQHTDLACKGALDLGPVDTPEYPVNRLTDNANGIVKFDVDARTGEIYSPEFIGRKKETAELRALVEGDDFSLYKSALVYGIRRTGKTSLLNYFKKYLNTYRPNIICVDVDCQSVRKSNGIQDVFIDRVIDQVGRALPELQDAEDWGRLKRLWYSDSFCADDNPEKLSLFYTDVKRLIGDKGLYLIIDEVDRLFEIIEKRQTETPHALDNLFGSISAMLNSSSCMQTVHFVLCGSNWLIRYNLLGDNKNQLLQRFGQQVIEVGKLPAEDAEEVIRSAYRDFPGLIITPEAIDWIWSYTNGLVWHTKLLAAKALHRAKDDMRWAVYPSDVQQCMPQVIDEQWCKQFYEGCETGPERQLVDAMQSLAAKRDGYVHVNRLSELLGWPVIEVQRVAVILKALKIVSAHPVDQQLYRFGQDIYRRYFRTRPSVFERVPEEPEIFVNKQKLDELRLNQQLRSAAEPAAGISADGWDDYDPF